MFENQFRLSPIIEGSGLPVTQNHCPETLWEYSCNKYYHNKISIRHRLVILLLRFRYTKMNTYAIVKAYKKAFPFMCISKKNNYKKTISTTLSKKVGREKTFQVCRGVDYKKYWTLINETSLINEINIEKDRWPECPEFTNSCGFFAVESPNSPRQIEIDKSSETQNYLSDARSPQNNRLINGYQGASLSDQHNSKPLEKIPSSTTFYSSDGNSSSRDSTLSLDTPYLKTGVSSFSRNLSAKFSYPESDFPLQNYLPSLTLHSLNSNPSATKDFVEKISSSGGIFLPQDDNILLASSPLNNATSIQNRILLPGHQEYSLSSGRTFMKNQPSYPSPLQNQLSLTGETSFTDVLSFAPDITPESSNVSSVPTLLYEDFPLPENNAATPNINTSCSNYFSSTPIQSSDDANDYSSHQFPIYSTSKDSNNVYQSQYTSNIPTMPYNASHAELQNIIDKSQDFLNKYDHENFTSCKPPLGAHLFIGIDMSVPSTQNHDYVDGPLQQNSATYNDL